MVAKFGPTSLDDFRITRGFRAEPNPLERLLGDAERGFAPLSKARHIEELEAIARDEAELIELLTRESRKTFKTIEEDGSVYLVGHPSIFPVEFSESRQPAVRRPSRRFVRKIDLEETRGDPHSPPAPADDFASRVRRSLGGK